MYLMKSFADKLLLLVPYAGVGPALAARVHTQMAIYSVAKRTAARVIDTNQSDKFNPSIIHKWNKSGMKL